MSPGSHAAGDGSFGRSAGIQAGRAALLIGVAVLVGVLLLHRTAGTAAPGPSVSVGGGGTTTPTSPPTSANTGGGTTGTTVRGATGTTSAQLRAPQDIKVLVANGTSTPGLAGRISNLLHSKGYTTLASTNSTQKPTGTIVYFAPGYSADAAALATKLNLPPSAVQTLPSPPPVSFLNGANILVVVGPDLANAGSTTSST